MVNVLFCAIFMVASLVSFTSAFNLGGVQRAFLGLYRGILDASVVVADANGSYQGLPHFDLNHLSNDLDIYFLNNLKPYCVDFAYELIPGGAYLPQPTQVEIALDVEVSLWVNKHYHAYFSLERNEDNG